MAQPHISRSDARSKDRRRTGKTSRRSRFINPHRLFHGVWLPQWLEERPEVSEKARSYTLTSPISPAARAVLGRHLGCWQKNSIARAGT